MFGNRRNLRRWALQVFLVWVFGIAAGIAHACALRLADHHHQDGVIVAASGHAADHAPVTHGHNDASRDDGVAQANCLDFCDKSSVSVPTLKVKLDQGGDAQPAALLASPLLAMVEWLVHVPVRPDGLIDRRGGPPLRIALQRLAL